ncbi:MAG: baseplate J/gp47 family protein, partial [Actinomycetes bacterium]
PGGAGPATAEPAAAEPPGPRDVPPGPSPAVTGTPQQATLGLAASPPVSSRAPVPVPPAPAPLPRSAAAPSVRRQAEPATASAVPRRRMATGARIAVGSIAVLVLLALIVLGSLLLPSATVEFTVRPTTLGPILLTITADPTVSVADPAAFVVPAARPTFPLSASGNFAASGTKVTDTKATGSVRWQNCDPTSAYRLPGGTVVRTPSGVAFTTDVAVFVPVAILTLPTITCQYRDVPVTAARAGEAGNVPAGTITTVPPAYNPVVLRVSNPAATTGGTHTETVVASQQDIDAATHTLDTQLDGMLQAAIANPAQVPTSSTVVDGTASRTPSVPGVDPATILGQAVATFDYTLVSTGSVTTIDRTSVTVVAEGRLRAEVPAGSQLVDGSVLVDLGTPVPQGQAVAIPASARAQVVVPVDASTIRHRVEGLSAADAQRALAGLGDVAISLWPFWVTTVPSYDFRVDVRIVSSAGRGSGSPTASPSAPATVAPSVGTPPAGSAVP